MNIIEVKDLKKSYLVPGHKKKTFNAVDRISLKIRKGEIYGILGPNGAGCKALLGHEQHQLIPASRLPEPLVVEELFCRLLGLWIYP